VRYIIISFENLWVDGIALYPFIFISKKISNYHLDSLINHERIHLRQQIELLIVPFYILYALQYLINFCIYRKHQKAYLNIVFEKEAYANDDKPSYLNQRKLWAFLSYL
jgi:hypothetical protein